MVPPSLASANNYLGLSNHPAVVAAALDAIKTHGFGLSSVRFICGTQVGPAWNPTLANSIARGRVGPGPRVSTLRETVAAGVPLHTTRARPLHPHPLAPLTLSPLTLSSPP